MDFTDYPDNKHTIAPAYVQINILLSSQGYAGEWPFQHWK